MHGFPVRRRLPGGIVSLSAVVLLVPLLATACDETTIVPPAGQDRAPRIHITNFVVGGSGDVEKTPVSTTTTVHVTVGTQLMIMGNAFNPAGGVQQFSLSVAQGGSTLYTVQATGAPDPTTHTVPQQLNIWGSDGAGHSGGRVALVFTMNATQQATVTATATNFNNMRTTITVTYVAGLIVPAPPMNVTQSGVQGSGDGKFLIIQGLSGATFVAGKRSLVRLFMASDQIAQVTSLYVSVSQVFNNRVVPLGSGPAVINFLVRAPDLIVDSKAPNGPSVGFVLPGSAVPTSGVYIISASARDSWGEELRQAYFTVGFRPTKDLRVLVVMGAGVIPNGAPYGPTPDWYFDLQQSMLRLGAMLPVRDGVQASLNGTTSNGLRYVIGTPCQSSPLYEDCVYGQARQINASAGDHVDIVMEWRPGLYAPLWNPPGDNSPGGNAGRPPAPYSDLRRASCVGGLWGSIQTTAPVCGQEIGHNLGLEPPTSPHAPDPRDPGHSKDPSITDPYSYDFVNKLVYSEVYPDIGDLMNNSGGGWFRGADDVAYNAYDWEYLRGGLDGTGGLMGLASTGTN